VGSPARCGHPPIQQGRPHRPIVGQSGMVLLVLTWGGVSSQCWRRLDLQRVMAMSSEALEQSPVSNRRPPGKGVRASKSPEGGFAPHPLQKLLDRS